MYRYVAGKKITAFAGKALQSSRNNDFSPEAAIAEVIDNSLEANAKNIHIKFIFKTPPGKKKERPYLIAFGDDGKGMNEEVLQLCLQLGYSDRYNSREGIGRFGVGMTNGAIRVCEFVEVYSRQKGGNWNYTFLDIENRPDNQDPGIEPVQAKSIPKEFQDLVGDHGTLVIWKNIDRIDADFNIEEIKHWLGRVYRKFIGKKIIKNGKPIDNPNVRKISIDDGKKVEQLVAFDPLYVIPNEQRPQDETAKLQAEKTFSFEVDEVDAPDGNEKTGNVTIRTSLTPESWRTHQGAGGSKENNERYLYENEGFSFLRAGREVYYGKVPHFKPNLVDLDRFWCCEIEFDPTLDYQFSVKNIKVGAKPRRELREAIQNVLGPIINNKYRKIIRDFWAKNKIEEYQEGEGPTGRHDPAEKNAKPVTKPKKPLSLAEQKKKAEEIANKRELEKEERKKFLEKLLDPNSPPFIIEENTKGRPDGTFIEMEPELGKKVIWYNLNHAFFKSIYDKLTEVKDLAKKIEPHDERLLDISNELKTDVDHLIYAFSDSYYDMISYDDEGKVTETLEDLLISWSQQLRKVYRSQQTKDNNA